jgi:hypothetical protein
MEQLPKRDHEIFQQIEEWVTGVAPKSTFPKSLEANVSTAYKAAVTLALPKNRGTIEEEDVHQVIADTVRLTLKGTSKSSKSIEKLLRQLLIGPSRYIDTGLFLSRCLCRPFSLSLSPGREQCSPL